MSYKHQAVRLHVYRPEGAYRSVAHGIIVEENGRSVTVITGRDQLSKAYLLLPGEDRPKQGTYCELAMPETVPSAPATVVDAPEPEPETTEGDTVSDLLS